MGRGDPSMPARAVLGKPVPPDEKKVSPGRVAPTCAAHVVARHPLKGTGESLPVPRSLRGGRGTHPFGVRSPRGTPKTIGAGGEELFQSMLALSRWTELVEVFVEGLSEVFHG